MKYNYNILNKLEFQLLQTMELSNENSTKEIKQGTKLCYPLNWSSKRVSSLILDKAIHNWGWNSLEFWILILMRRLSLNEEKSLIRIRYYKSPELKPSFIKQYPILLTFRSSFFFGYPLEPCIEIWQIFLNFGKNLAIENLKKHLILALYFLI